MTIETAINNALSRHDFKQISDLSKEELVSLLTEILVNFTRTNEFKDGVWNSRK